MLIKLIIIMNSIDTILKLFKNISYLGTRKGTSSFL